MCCDVPTGTVGCRHNYRRRKQVNNVTIKSRLTYDQLNAMIDDDELLYQHELATSQADRIFHMCKRWDDLSRGTKGHQVDASRRIPALIINSDCQHGLMNLWVGLGDRNINHKFSHFALRCPCRLRGNYCRLRSMKGSIRIPQKQVRRLSPRQRNDWPNALMILTGSPD